MSTLNTTNLKNPSSASNNIVLAADGSTTIATLNSTTITGTSVRGGITSGTSVASTSGTSIDFTSIPSYVKRVTVMFNGVSTTSTSVVQIQLGDSGGVETSGYTAMVSNVQTTPNTTRGVTASSGFLIQHANSSAESIQGAVIFSLFESNTWVAQGTLYGTTTGLNSASGSKTLSGTLDRIRITTVNGTDTFDAGSINIMYEG